ncbi:STAS domain-containing protein [Candidatus Foliamicus sp.]
MIETERDGPVLSVKLQGRLDASSANALFDGVEAAVTPDDSAVVIDMAQLAYISSAGLRVLLMLAKMLEERNARFAVCSLSKQVSEIFDITGFDKVIGVHQSPEQARAAVIG